MQAITGTTQSYDWGKLGDVSQVAKLASANGLVPDISKPYAELWMGTHPNGPSTITGSATTLKSLLNKQTLSPGIYEKYNGDLPFLFKVLSIRKALSIQAHPDKILAAKLHAERPDIYKDGNHKPEMAIALTEFEAFIAFRPLEEIAQHLKEYPEFRDLVGQAGIDFTVSGDVAKNKESLKKLFHALQTSTQEQITEAIRKLISRIHTSTKPLDQLLCRLDSQFKNDVGTFCAFLLNYVTLKPGEAIFLAANEPHAYLSGDCIECMAASDNVVRSGLTPKYKDVDTLVSMLTYNYGSANRQILTGEQVTKQTKEYDPPIEEFSIYQTVLDNQNELQAGVQGPSIIIVVNGNGTFAGDKEFQAKPGTILFVPSGMEINVKSFGADKLIFYRAFCELPTSRM
ncbi:Mannose-6-phosphate isomerase [Boothiomyces sp. JEL0838]|nr:Mannose-6-phosphate isomerase [Boothiomyces sp. JEL0838]